MKRIADWISSFTLLGALALTASASAPARASPRWLQQDNAVIQVRGGMDMATAIWAAAAAATITAGEEAAATTTAGVTIAHQTGIRFRHIIARTKANLAMNWPRPSAAVQFLSGIGTESDRQPRPISTAIRIRSEWFLAPSFCFSSDVTLATVL